MYKFFNGTNWPIQAFFSSCGLSGFYCVTLGLVYCLEYIETGRFVVSEILMQIFFLMAINVPSALAGCFFGYQEPKFYVHNKPSRIVRKIPSENTCLLNPVICFTLCAIIPFSVIGTQFYYVFSSISGGQNITVLYWSIYLSCTTLLLLIAEAVVVQNYISLCYGNWQWWWRTFAYGASIGVCIFGAMTYHLLTRVTIYHITTLMTYVLLQVVISISIGLSTGALAVLAVFIFNDAIYRKTRID